QTLFFDLSSFVSLLSQSVLSLPVIHLERPLPPSISCLPPSSSLSHSLCLSIPLSLSLSPSLSLSLSLPLWAGTIHISPPITDSIAPSLPLSLPRSLTHSFVCSLTPTPKNSA